MAALAVVLVLDATRRTIGAALPIVAASFILYALAGPWLPGIFHHRGLTLEILLDQTSFTTEGIFGIPLGVAGSYAPFHISERSCEKSGAANSS